MFTKNFLSRVFLKNSSLNKIKIRSLQTKSIRNLLDLDLSKNNDLLAKPVKVVGWVKSLRDHKEIKFMHINDGSDSRNLQLVFLKQNYSANLDKYETLFDSLHFNASIEVTGVLAKSTHKKQNLELQVTDLNIISSCEPEGYPFQYKKAYTLEQLRHHTHLRTHVDLFASVMRFRSELTMNIHQFFHSQNFYQIHTPILSSNNCEGGCETFQVVCNDKDKSLDINQKDLREKLTKMNGEANEQLLSQSSNLKHFFLKPVYLTASAQLHLETMTSTLAKVYTLSPTFRAEKSLTRHHLAEFYMLEAEMIDMNNLDQLLDFVEVMVRELTLNVYNKFSKYDLELIMASTTTDKTNKNKSNEALGYVDKIKESLSKNFIRITYKDAIVILNDLIKSNKKLKLAKKSIEYGDDLNKEQEKLLVEHFKQTPVFVTNYPRSIKPFYMRRNLDNPDLVDNFDLLAPNVGEIIGGSLREHRIDLLGDAIKEQNLDLDLFKGYLETKKYGSMKMGGRKA
jgi:asparaginyl-tRNA synthetase